MIQFFHKYRRGTFGILVVGIAALSMSSFGVNLYSNYQADRNYAIKVDEQIIRHADVTRAKEELRSRYRQMFGQNYPQIAKFVEQNLGQQVVDKLIADALLEKLALDSDLFVGEGELQRILTTEVFPQGFDIKTYSAALRQLGMTAPQFEAELQKAARRSLVSSLLRDAAVASSAEAQDLYRRQETKFDVVSISFNPTTLIEQVPTPSDDNIQGYYQEHATEFEAPATVKFEYAVLNPSQFLDLVQPNDDDIELYYDDRREEYLTKPQIKAHHIQLTFAKDAKPEAMAKRKEQAVALLAKLKAGEEFAKLAKESSDDLSTSLSGGDLGWISPGKQSPEFDKAAFALKAGELSELIETPYGFHIIKVDETKEPQARPLEEVRAGIVQELKLREAPAYTADLGARLYQAWAAAPDLGLAELLAQEPLAKSVTIEATTDHLADGSDPKPELLGLTREILRNPEESRQRVEIGDLTVLVAVKEYREPTVQPLDAVKTKVIDILRQNEAKKLAEVKAKEAIAALSKGEFSDLEALAKAWKLEPTVTKDLTRAQGGSGIFSEPTLRNAVFGTGKAGALPEKTYAVQGNQVVIQVQKITPPAPPTPEVLARYQSQASSEYARLVEQSVLNSLKAKARIDIVPSLAG